MRNLEKYKGIIPAFYACYDKDGKISPEGVKALTKYFVEKGVKAYMSTVLPESAFTRAFRNGSLYWKAL